MVFLRLGPLAVSFHDDIGFHKRRGISRLNERPSTSKKDSVASNCSYDFLCRRILFLLASLGHVM
jgi:hypothetical protein